MPLLSVINVCALERLAAPVRSSFESFHMKKIKKTLVLTTLLAITARYYYILIISVARIKKKKVGCTSASNIFTIIVKLKSNHDKPSLGFEIYNRLKGRRLE